MTANASSVAADLEANLAVFGFSETEIETYLAILSGGEPTTRTVAEEAGVTQRAVYDIADRLAERGLVRVNDHASPTTIRARPPSEAIDGLTDRLESVRPTLEAAYEETTTGAPDIRIVESRQTAIARLRDAIAAAEHEVALAIPAGVYPTLEADLAAAIDRDVFVLLLVGECDGLDDLEGDPGGVADVVRVWDEPLQFASVVDDREAMIGESGILAATHTDEHAVYVEEGNLAGSIFSAFLGGYWPAATERSVTDPDPLPRTFDWFRRATFQATLHDRAGVDLHAEVETVDGTSLAGSVVGIDQQFVDPRSGAFPLRNSLVVDAGDDEVTLGGPGSFIEDAAVASITLSAASEQAERTHDRETRT